MTTDELIEALAGSGLSDDEYAAAVAAVRALGDVVRCSNALLHEVLVHESVQPAPVLRVASGLWDALAARAEEDQQHEVRRGGHRAA